jgi:hypothetical protein
MKTIISTPFVYLRRFTFAIDFLVERDVFALWIEAGHYQVQVPFLRKRVR